jgi:transposase
MAEITRKTKRYPSDLTDEEWEQIAPLMPRPRHRGRPREVDLREIINAVRYLVRSGCGWEMLPVHFGPWQTVYARRSLQRPMKCSYSAGSVAAKRDWVRPILGAFAESVGEEARPPSPSQVPHYRQQGPLESAVRC